MSELNRCLLSAHRLGADHQTFKVLSTQAAYKVHSYLLSVAVDSPDTYTTLNELTELLGVPLTTAYRTIKQLDAEGLLVSRRDPPQRKGSEHGAGGRGATGWRAKL